MQVVLQDVVEAERQTMPIRPGQAREQCRQPPSGITGSVAAGGPERRDPGSWKGKRRQRQAQIQTRGSSEPTNSSNIVRVNRRSGNWKLRAANVRATRNPRKTR